MEQVWHITTLPIVIIMSGNAGVVLIRDCALISMWGIVFRQSTSKHGVEETLGKFQNLIDYLTKILVCQIINIDHRLNGFYITGCIYYQT